MSRTDLAALDELRRQPPGRINRRLTDDTRDLVDLVLLGGQLLFEGFELLLDRSELVHRMRIQLFAFGKPFAECLGHASSSSSRFGVKRLVQHYIEKTKGDGSRCIVT